MRPWQALLLIVTGLLVLGAIAVQSAGLTVGRTNPAIFSSMVLSRTTMLALLALLALLAGMFVPLNKLEPPKGRWLPLMLLGISILLLIAVQIPGIGREVHGSKRWIDIGPIGFQPSEVAKWSLVFFLAWQCARKVDVLDRFRKGFYPVP